MKSFLCKTEFTDFDDTVFFNSTTITSLFLKSITNFWIYRFSFYLNSFVCVMCLTCRTHIAKLELRNSYAGHFSYLAKNRTLFGLNVMPPAAQSA